MQQISLMSQRETKPRIPSIEAYLSPDKTEGELTERHSSSKKLLKRDTRNKYDETRSEILNYNPFQEVHETGSYHAAQQYIRKRKQFQYIRKLSPSEFQDSHSQYSQGSTSYQRAKLACRLRKQLDS